jgi:hypothetical protein
LNAESGQWTELPSDDPDLLAFLSSVQLEKLVSVDVQKSLGNTDLALARVLEDLIDLLVDRSIIRFTDFPPAAQAKLMDRRDARHALRKLSLLLDDADGENETL